MIFINTLIMGILISISSYSWMGMWMGLEINMLSIIPLMNNSKNMFSSEASLKYFITQSMASMILLFSIIMMLSNIEFITPMMNSSWSMIMSMSLLTKLGAAPFHFWFPEVMEGLNWINCTIILTIQKIAPSILLINNELNTKMMISIISISLLIAGMMGFNQTSLRKIMTFSSINHIAWMITAMMISLSIWLIYFIIYTIISINIIFMFYSTNSFYLKQLINSMNKNKIMKFTLMLNFLSLAGLPPFLGFLPKWLTINWLIFNDFYLLTFLLIILTMISMYIYIRIIFTTLIINHNENMNKISIKNYFMILFNFISINSLIIFTLLFNMM
uniref:NADH-ubiquinone oxidoreductase chain 2 n=1 Tax=Tenebrionoidea sp. 21 KM-2017 TaxID=2219477 RepID=A0A346RI54_9CUCU|nr:NADH dehydrogenase subunit 2 [Tenebrionoidea sp. 21 KM-2017]